MVGRPPRSEFLWPLGYVDPPDLAAKLRNVRSALLSRHRLLPFGQRQRSHHPQPHRWPVGVEAGGDPQFQCTPQCLLCRRSPVIRSGTIAQ